MASKFSIRNILEVAGGVTGLSAIIGGWLYVDSYFAKAADLSSMALSLERSQILMRIDILEDRIDREHEKEHTDERRIEKMENQIRRLELRGSALLNKGTN